MCEPVSIGMAIISAGAMVAQQVQVAGEARRAKKSETANFLNQSKALNTRAEQVDDRAQMEKTERQKQAMIEQGRINVLQGESGLFGASHDYADTESMFNASFDIASLESNRRAEQEQLKYEGANLGISSRNRFNAIKKPDWIGTGLNIAGTALGTYKPSTGSPSGPSKVGRANLSSGAITSGSAPNPFSSSAWTSRGR